jgi:hypothetical protein
VRSARGRATRIKKASAGSRRPPFTAGQALQNQLEEQLHTSDEIVDEDDEGDIGPDSQGELDEDDEEETKREQHQQQQALLGHGDVIAGGHQHLHEQQQQQQQHHLDDGSHQQHHQAGSDHHLQILAAANSLVNGSTLAHGADPSIHPALQGMGTHHAFASMDPPPAPQPQHHQGDNPMQGHAVVDQQQVAHAPQHMHAQHHGASNRTAEQFARESGYPELTIDSALSKRLAREPGVRLAMQRRDEQQLNLKRRSNVEALLAHVSGIITASPCTNCHKGHGPWTSCVVVDGQMCGSCSNCWYNASGARCSFHEVRNPQAQHQPSVLASTSPFIQPMAAAAAAQALSQGMMPNASPSMGTISYDANVRYVVDTAMQSVRNTGGDQRARLLARIETHARTLALSIQEYEGWVQSEEAAMSHQDVQAAAAAAGASADTPNGDETMTESGH